MSRRQERAGACQQQMVREVDEGGQAAGQRVEAH